MGCTREKLGQADSRQAESGRGSRVVQAFSVGSSPLETTPKPVVATPVYRRSILESSYRLGNFIPWSRTPRPLPCSSTLAGKKDFGECSFEIVGYIPHIFCHLDYLMSYEIVERVSKK